jgi:helix-turn-helix protein
MSEEMVTVQEAADLLGVSVSQMNNIVRRGSIQPYSTDGRVTRHKRLFRLSDIAALREVRSKGYNLQGVLVESRHSAIETRALRRELDRVKFLLGIDIPSLPTDRDTLVALLLRAEDAIRELATQNPHELLGWARVLYAIGEAHLEAITYHTGQQEPWRVFLNLGRHLCLGQDFQRTIYDGELHNIYLLLNAGLRRARQAAYFHVRSLNGKTKAEEMFPEAKNCVHESVIAMSFNNMAWDGP